MSDQAAEEPVLADDTPPGTAAAATPAPVQQYDDPAEYEREGPAETVARNSGLRMPLSVFARTLGPQERRVPNMQRPGTMKNTLVPGQADEVYIKLLRRRHGRENHTATGWQALIEAMRNEPAHPSVLGA